MPREGSFEILRLNLALKAVSNVPFIPTTERPTDDNWGHSRTDGRWEIQKKINPFFFRDRPKTDNDEDRSWVSFVLFLVVKRYIWFERKMRQVLVQYHKCVDIGQHNSWRISMLAMIRSLPRHVLGVKFDRLRSRSFKGSHIVWGAYIASGWFKPHSNQPQLIHQSWSKNRVYHSGRDMKISI